MALSVQHVSFGYPEETHPALERITLELEAGQFVLLLGANGSGKSTLIHLMSGLLLPDQGQVVVDGMPTHLPAHRLAIRRTVGLLLQHPENQIVAQTVADEVAFGLENLGFPAPVIRQKVFQTLERVGLRAQADDPPDALS